MLIDLFNTHDPRNHCLRRASDRFVPILNKNRQSGNKIPGALISEIYDLGKMVKKIFRGRTNLLQKNRQKKQAT